MKRCALILIIITILSACSRNREAIEEPQQEVTQSTVQVPIWFLQPPQGDFSIGISKLSVHNLQMKTAALQNAVVQYCRNNSSYIVNKKAFRETDFSTNGGTAEFQLIVNSEPELLHSAAENLKLLDDFWFFDNYIGLYGYNSTDIDTNLVMISFSEIPEGDTPDWFGEDIYLDGANLLTNIRADSHSLEFAWVKAMDLARIELAGWLETGVSSTIYQVNEKIDKLVALETTRKMRNINLKHCYIKRYNGSGGPGYAVFIQAGIKI